jgi:type IV secretion system protein VirB1
MISIAQLSAECAPMVAPSTMAAIVRVESGGNPLAMWNNSTRSMVIPGNLSQAVRYLRQAMAAGQRVDVGLAQVDTENFAAYGLTPASAFDACVNLRAGAEILSADYRQAKVVYGPGQVALYHAFEAYNSGRLSGDSRYANQILSAADADLPLVRLPLEKAGPLAAVETWGTGIPYSGVSGLAYVLKWGSVPK